MNKYSSILPVNMPNFTSQREDEEERDHWIQYNCHTKIQRKLSHVKELS